MSQEQEISPQYLGSGSQSIASFSPLPKRSHDPLTTLMSSASLANGSIPNHKVPATTTIAPMVAKRDVTTVTGTSCSPIVSHEGQPLNVGAVEFNPNTFVKGTSSTPYASHGFDIPKENPYGTPESHALKTTERTFQDVMALQQRQKKGREQTAHQQALRTLLNLWNQLLTLQMILYSARRLYKAGRVQKLRGTKGTLTQETAFNQSTKGTALPPILVHLPIPGSYMGPGLQVRLAIALCASFAAILMTWMTVNSSRNKQEIKEEPS